MHPADMLAFTVTHTYTPPLLEVMPGDCHGVEALAWIELGQTGSCCVLLSDSLSFQIKSKVYLYLENSLKLLT